MVVAVKMEHEHTCQARISGNRWPTVGSLFSFFFKTAEKALLSAALVDMKEQCKEGRRGTAIIIITIKVSP